MVLAISSLCFVVVIRPGKGLEGFRFSKGLYWASKDIPLHALAMLKFPRDGITNAVQQIADLKTKGHQLAYVGDVVGTGSSRKSATNSILWYMGQDIPCAPNKRTGGFVIGGVIAPIFFNTMEDSGALPLEMDVKDLNMGDLIDLCVYDQVTGLFSRNLLLYVAKMGIYRI